MKKLYILIVAMLLSAVSVMAQPYAGAVIVTCNELEERDGRLHIDLDIHVHSKAMNTTQSWTIIPRITASPEVSADFPSVLVNGRNKRQIYERRERFESRTWLANKPAYLVNVDHRTDTLVRYVANMPYQEWMDDAYLVVDQVLTSCADQEQLFMVDLEKPVLVVREPYIPQPIYSFVTPQKEAVKRRDVHAQAYLDFEVGKWTILPDFRRNPQELEKIRQTVGDLRNNTDVKITGSAIQGFASPEGSYALNTKLSANRAESFRKYLQDTYGLSGTVTSVPEDWKGLRDLVEQSTTLPNKSEVLALIDNSDDWDVKESKLRQLGGGEAYRIMLRDMFPQLRRVEYRVDFEVRDFNEEESKNILEKDPSLLSNYELYQLANTYQQGSAQYNRVYDLILNRYPDDPATLVNGGAVLISRGDYEGARRLLERGGTTRMP